MHGKYLLLICADYTIFWVKGTITTVKKNTGAALVATYKVGLEVNAEETKYKFISHTQNAGKNLSQITSGLSQCALWTVDCSTQL
jgi:hypothetical protein